MPPIEHGKLGSERVAEIIRDAGGEFTGWVRLHKTAYLLELCGLGAGFDFEFCSIGLFSEELEFAVASARARGLIEEEKRKTSRGSLYSIFRSTAPPPSDRIPAPRSEFIRVAAKANAAELALVATAAFLSSRWRTPDPWDETAKRDPVTAKDGRLQNAIALYGRLMQVPTPRPLPQIA